ncbi:MAG TPA: hypothetical protein VGI64_12295 [Streptosporangiaceae bacterium]|jgi:hypothetical protein
MSIGLVYLCYLLISLGLVFLAGRALTRNGRLLLLDGRGGNDGAAEGLSNLLVVAFYLLALGFVALTMRAGGEVATGRQVLQLLAAKVGYVLLLLGALYLASIAVLTRLRRRTRLVLSSGGAGRPAQARTSAGDPSVRADLAESGLGAAGPGQPAGAGAALGTPVHGQAGGLPDDGELRSRSALPGRLSPGQPLWRPSRRAASG